MPRTGENISNFQKLISLKPHDFRIVTNSKKFSPKINEALPVQLPQRNFFNAFWNGQYQNIKRKSGKAFFINNKLLSQPIRGFQNLNPLSLNWSRRLSRKDNNLLKITIDWLCNAIVLQSHHFTLFYGEKAYVRSFLPLQGFRYLSPF